MIPSTAAPWPWPNPRPLAFRVTHLAPKAELAYTPVLVVIPDHHLYEAAQQANHHHHDPSHPRMFDPCQASLPHGQPQPHGLLTSSPPPLTLLGGYLGLGSPPTSARRLQRNSISTMPMPPVPGGSEQHKREWRTNMTWQPINNLNPRRSQALDIQDYAARSTTCSHHSERPVGKSPGRDRRCRSCTSETVRQASAKSNATPRVSCGKCARSCWIIDS